MFAYYWPIGLLVLSNVFYHITAKSIPSDVDAFFRWWMEENPDQITFDDLQIDEEE